MGRGIFFRKKNRWGGGGKDIVSGWVGCGCSAGCGFINLGLLAVACSFRIGRRERAGNGDGGREKIRGGWEGEL